MLFGRFIQSKQVDKVAPFHDPLKTEIENTCLWLCNQKGCHIYNAHAINYDELYMLHP